MKKRKLVVSVVVTGMLLSSSATIFAAESTQKPSVISDSVQDSAVKQPVYGMAVYLQLVKEVEQGLITTDKQAWERMAELDALNLPEPIQPRGSSYGDYLSKAGEFAACVLAVGPIDTATAKSDADKATAAAQSSGYSGAHNGKQDAFRHAYWNVLMTRDIGAGQAKEVADIHEEYNPGPSIEHNMDDFNNMRGRNAYTGSVTSDSGLVTVIKSKVNSGDLLYIKNGILVYTNE